MVLPCSSWTVQVTTCKSRILSRSCLIYERFVWPTFFFNFPDSVLSLPPFHRPESLQSVTPALTIRDEQKLSEFFFLVCTDSLHVESPVSCTWKSIYGVSRNSQYVKPSIKKGRHWRVVDRKSFDGVGRSHPPTVRGSTGPTVNPTDFRSSRLCWMSVEDYNNLPAPEFSCPITSTT